MIQSQNRIAFLPATSILNFALPHSLQAAWPLIQPPGANSSLIQVDYVKVAERMGLKNPRSVSNAWSLIKKKIQTFDKEERKRKGLPSEDEAEDDAETVKKSPKRARATKAAGTPKSAKVAKTGKASTPRTPRAKKSDLFVAAEDLAGDDEEDELKMEVKTEVKAEAMVKAEDMVKAEPEAEDADTI